VAVVLDFRYEVASAMIDGDLDVFYIVANPYIVFGNDMCIYKTNKVIITSGNLAAILDF